MNAAMNVLIKGESEEYAKSFGKKWLAAEKRKKLRSGPDAPEARGRASQAMPWAPVSKPTMFYKQEGPSDTSRRITHDFRDAMRLSEALASKVRQLDRFESQ